MSKKTLQINQLLTLGGRVECNQCQARSKRSGLQCQGPAVKGKQVCRMHGGKSTGPRTPEGRQRCAASKTVHGHETASIRMERRVAGAQLAVLEAVGHALGFMYGARTRGRKPAGMHEAYPELQAALGGSLRYKVRGV